MTSADYHVDWNRIARKALAALPIDVAKSLVDRAEELGRNPFPADCRPVKGLTRRHRVWRIRVGHYRIAYQVFEEHKEVVIVGVAARGSIYEILRRQFR